MMDLLKACKDAQASGMTMTDFLKVWEAEVKMQQTQDELKLLQLRSANPSSEPTIFVSPTSLDEKLEKLRSEQQEAMTQLKVDMLAQNQANIADMSHLLEGFASVVGRVVKKELETALATMSPVRDEKPLAANNGPTSKANSVDNRSSGSSLTWSAVHQSSPPPSECKSGSFVVSSQNEKQKLKQQENQIKQLQNHVKQLQSQNKQYKDQMKKQLQTGHEIETECESPPPPKQSAEKKKRKKKKKDDGQKQSEENVAVVPENTSTQSLNDIADYLHSVDKRKSEDIVAGVPPTIPENTSTQSLNNDVDHQQSADKKKKRKKKGKGQMKSEDSVAGVPDNTSTQYHKDVVDYSVGQTAATHFFPEEGPVNMIIYDSSNFARSGRVETSPVYYLQDCPCKVQFLIWFSNVDDQLHLEASMHLWGLADDDAQTYSVLVTGTVQNKNSGSYSNMLSAHSPAVNLHKSGDMQVIKVGALLKTQSGKFPDVTYDMLQQRNFIWDTDREKFSINWTISKAVNEVDCKKTNGDDDQVLVDVICGMDEPRLLQNSE